MMNQAGDRKVTIVIVNWNNWRDTLACLESVFRTSYEDFNVIVCDNNSSDGSLEKIKGWADGELEAKPPDDQLLAGLVRPLIEKPIPYTVYTRNEVENQDLEITEAPLILIDIGANLGFAGGNNLGIQYALSHYSAYVWLLNNDTLIREDSLSQLVARMQSDPSVGICGSTVLYFDNPLVVQTQGGSTYNKWLGTGSNIGHMCPYSDMIDPATVEKKMDYVFGASMLISAEFLSTIGLLNEQFFLYYEEADLAIRGKNRFSLAYAPGSIVYHKGGASIGSSLSSSSKLRDRSEFYLVRNRIKFTTLYYPYALPVMYLFLLITVGVRILRGQWSRAGSLLNVLFIGKEPELD